jgi:hypothetical protein
MCPNCDNPSIGYWQKQFLEPARTIGCSLCGARVSVSTMRFVPIFLFIIGAVPASRKLGLMEYGFASYGGVLVFMLLITGLYQHFFVPLVVRSRLPIE